MNTQVLQRDIAHLLTAKTAIAITNLTAAGAGDNTAITGITIDRGKIGMPLSAAIVVPFTAVLAEAATLTLKTAKIEQSADGSSWDATAYNAFTDPGVVATGPTGGGTVHGMVKLAIDLSSAKQFVRFDLTPDLSASGTDTAKVAAAWNFAGVDRLPTA